MAWGDIYRRFLRKGHDHGSAAFEADKWEKRAKSRGAYMQPMPDELPKTNENIVMWTVAQFNSLYGFHDSGDYTAMSRLVVKALNEHNPRSG